MTTLATSHVIEERRLTYVVCSFRKVRGRGSVCLRIPVPATRGVRAGLPRRCVVDVGGRVRQRSAEWIPASLAAPQEPAARGAVVQRRDAPYTVPSRN